MWARWEHIYSNGFIAKPYHSKWTNDNTIIYKITLQDGYHTDEEMAMPLQAVAPLQKSPQVQDVFTLEEAFEEADR